MKRTEEASPAQHASFTIWGSDADALRSLLAGVSFTERRKLWLWREFTVSAQPDVIAALRARVRAMELELWREAQW